MFHPSSFVRGHFIPFLFGLSMMLFGCANFGEKAANLSSAYDRNVSAPTTQLATSVGQTAGVIAATAPGTPLGNAGLVVMTVAGAIIALDRIISGTLKQVALASAKTPPVAATNSNDQNQPGLGGDNPPKT